MSFIPVETTLHSDAERAYLLEIVREQQQILTDYGITVDKVFSMNDSYDTLHTGYLIMQTSIDRLRTEVPLPKEAAPTRKRQPIVTNEADTE